MESSELRWKKYSFASDAVMKPKPRSATTFLMVPVATVDLPCLPEQLALTHDLFEKQRSHGATAKRGVSAPYATDDQKANACSPCYHLGYFVFVGRSGPRPGNFRSTSTKPFEP